MEFLFVFSDAPICQSQLVDQLIGVTAEESISINCRVSKYTKKDKIELDLKKVWMDWMFASSSKIEDKDFFIIIIQGIM